MTILYSWNVNGLRAAGRKGILDWLAEEQPDVLALQETKCHPDQLDGSLRRPPGYHAFFASAERKGYSGVAVYAKEEPTAVQVGLGVPEYDAEGRTLVLHFDDFVLINAYFPNGGRDKGRVPFKMAYKATFHAFCNELRNAGKNVLFCGDINTAHKEIDLARPRPNRKNTGFLPEERAWLDDITADGWIDTYRHFFPEQTGAYTWWTAIGGARSRNVGWRLDYFFADEGFMPRITQAAIHPDVMGSDHCPVSVVIGAAL